MITQARLKELLDYDPETGVFVNRVWRGGTAWAGAPAGSKNNLGYIQLKVGGSMRLAHRLAWLYVTGKTPLKQIDHINCVRDDNRFSNLREASHAENRRNAPKQANNTSGVKGTYWDASRGKWQVQIGVGRTRVFVDRFDLIEEAAAAYAEASARLHKSFGRLA